MRELSLFTGAGGGLLGTHLLGWTPVGYVEFEDYPQRVLRARIDDGILPDAPIFGDIRTFISEGYAESYKGMVDVITAGFPCQPFSGAGKQLGEDDPRNMWPATLECIRMVRPQYCFLENVSGLLTSGYFGTILGGLVESGYDCRWRILSVAEMGGKIKRDRLWIVAESKSNRLDAIQPPNNGKKRKGGKEAIGRTDRQGITMGQEGVTVSTCEWSLPPEPIRMVDELAGHMDRLKAIGNGQVPAVVRAAWELLND